ncbi:MAG: hypothetical protein JKY02_00980 [Flavobacteriaceae bacterium]|nr:hypothetical protein [Flavobacteriaceae bacterium]
MDVEIDNLDISAGVDDGKEEKKGLNHEFDEAQLELQIERCVVRLLRQMARE